MSTARAVWRDARPNRRIDARGSRWSSVRNERTNPAGSRHDATHRTWGRASATRSMNSRCPGVFSITVEQSVYRAMAWAIAMKAPAGVVGPELPEGLGHELRIDPPGQPGQGVPALAGGAGPLLGGLGRHDGGEIPAVVATVGARRPVAPPKEVALSEDRHPRRGFQRTREEGRPAASHAEQ